MTLSYTRAKLHPVSPFDQTVTRDLRDVVAQVVAKAFPLTRQTFHVNIEECPNVPLLKRTLDSWHPSAVLLLGNRNAPNTLGRELMAQVAQWNGIGIYRPFENREGDIWTQRIPRDHVYWLLSMHLPENCWVNVGNEPVPNEFAAREQMCPWYAEFTDIAVSEGLNIIVPGGFASGAFELSAIEGGWFDGLLHAIAKYATYRHRGYSRVMLGAHTYGHGLLPWHTAGRDVHLLMNKDAIQKAAWPTKAQIFDGDESDNWLVLRENWLLNRMRKLESNPALNVDVAITECWFDRMPNIVQQYPQVAAFIDGKAGREVRGLPTVRGYLAWAFPQWTFAEAVCQQLAWAERVYPAHYRAFVNFAWTQNGLWHDGYDWSGLEDVLMEWPKMMTQGDSPLEYPEMTVVLKNGAKQLKFRQDASTTLEARAILSAGESINYDPMLVSGQTLTPGGDQWLRCYHQRLQEWGYVFAYYIEIPAAPPSGDYVTRTELDALKAEVQAFRTDVLKALGELKDSLNAELNDMPDRTFQILIDRLQKKEVA